MAGEEKETAAVEASTLVEDAVSVREEVVTIEALNGNNDEKTEEPRAVEEAPAAVAATEEEAQPTEGMAPVQEESKVEKIAEESEQIEEASVPEEAIFVEEIPIVPQESDVVEEVKPVEKEENGAAEESKPVEGVSVPEEVSAIEDTSSVPEEVSVPEETVVVEETPIVSEEAVSVDEAPVPKEDEVKPIEKEEKDVVEEPGEVSTPDETVVVEEMPMVSEEAVSVDEAPVLKEVAVVEDMSMTPVELSVPEEDGAIEEMQTVPDESNVIEEPKQIEEVSVSTKENAVVEEKSAVPEEFESNSAGEEMKPDEETIVGTSDVPNETLVPEEKEELVVPEQLESVEKTSVDAGEEKVVTEEISVPEEEAAPGEQDKIVADDEPVTVQKGGNVTGTEPTKPIEDSTIEEEAPVKEEPFVVEQTRSATDLEMIREEEPAERAKEEEQKPSAAPRSRSSSRQSSEERRCMTVMAVEVTVDGQKKTKSPSPAKDLFPLRYIQKQQQQQQQLEEAQEPASVFLDAAFLPAESQLMVTEAECRAEAVPRHQLELDANEYEASPVVLSGKMTLSVIGVDLASPSPAVEVAETSDSRRASSHHVHFNESAQLRIIPADYEDVEETEELVVDVETDVAAPLARPPTPPLLHGGVADDEGEFLTYDQLDEAGEVNEPQVNTPMMLHEDQHPNALNRDSNASNNNRHQNLLEDTPTRPCDANENPSNDHPTLSSAAPEEKSHASRGPSAERQVADLVELPERIAIVDQTAPDAANQEHLVASVAPRVSVEDGVLEPCSTAEESQPAVSMTAAPEAEVPVITPASVESLLVAESSVASALQVREVSNENALENVIESVEASEAPGSDSLLNEQPIEESGACLKESLVSSEESAVKPDFSSGLGSGENQLPVENPIEMMMASKEIIQPSEASVEESLVPLDVERVPVSEESVVFPETSTGLDDETNVLTEEKNVEASIDALGRQVQASGASVEEPCVPLDVERVPVSEESVVLLETPTGLDADTDRFTEEKNVEASTDALENQVQASEASLEEALVPLDVKQVPAPEESELLQEASTAFNSEDDRLRNENRPGISIDESEKQIQTSEESTSEFLMPVDVESVKVFQESQMLPESSIGLNAGNDDSIGKTEKTVESSIDASEILAKEVEVPVEETVVPFNAERDLVESEVLPECPVSQESQDLSESSKDFADVHEQLVQESETPAKESSVAVDSEVLESEESQQFSESSAGVSFDNSRLLDGEPVETTISATEELVQVSEASLEESSSSFASGDVHEILVQESQTSVKESSMPLDQEQGLVTEESPQFSESPSGVNSENTKLLDGESDEATINAPEVPVQASEASVEESSGAVEADRAPVSEDSHESSESSKDSADAHEILVQELESSLKEPSVSLDQEQALATEESSHLSESAVLENVENNQLFDENLVETSISAPEELVQTLEVSVEETSSSSEANRVPASDESLASPKSSNELISGSGPSLDESLKGSTDADERLAEESEASAEDSLISEQTLVTEESSQLSESLVGVHSENTELIDGNSVGDTMNAPEELVQSEASVGESAMPLEAERVPASGESLVQNENTVELSIDSSEKPVQVSETLIEKSVVLLEAQVPASKESAVLPESSTGLNTRTDDLLDEKSIIVAMNEPVELLEVSQASVKDSLVDSCPALEDSLVMTGTKGSSDERLIQRQTDARDALAEPSLQQACEAFSASSEASAPVSREAATIEPNDASITESLASVASLGPVQVDEILGESLLLDVEYQLLSTATTASTDATDATDAVQAATDAAQDADVAQAATDEAQPTISSVVIREDFPEGEELETEQQREAEHAAVADDYLNDNQEALDSEVVIYEEMITEDEENATEAEDFSLVNSDVVIHEDLIEEDDENATEAGEFSMLSQADVDMARHEIEEIKRLLASVPDSDTVTTQSANVRVCITHPPESALNFHHLTTKNPRKITTNPPIHLPTLLFY